MNYLTLHDVFSWLLDPNYANWNASVTNDSPNVGLQLRDTKLIEIFQFVLQSCNCNGIFDYLFDKSVNICFRAPLEFSLVSNGSPYLGVKRSGMRKRIQQIEETDFQVGFLVFKVF